MSPYEHWLHVALEAAAQAGDLLKQAWQGTHHIRFKSPRNIVTDMDMTIEASVLPILHNAFPDHAITSEEAGADEVDAPIRWFVDPLDGTTNFSRDNPNFCISIAATEVGEPVVGVILDPLRNMVFSTYAGGGAWLNGTSMRVSGVTDIDKAVVSFDTPRNPEARQKMMANIQNLAKHVRTLRGLGSAALNMAYIAAGWTDVYLALDMSPWDQMAAALMVAEAGGVVGTISGRPWGLTSQDPLMVASAELELTIRRIVEGGSV